MTAGQHGVKKTRSQKQLHCELGYIKKKQNKKTPQAFFWDQF